MALSVDRPALMPKAKPAFNLFACYCGVSHSIAAMTHSDSSPDSSPDSAQLKLRRVGLTLFSVTFLFGAEWGISLWSGSLSVQADAAHLISWVDVTSLKIWQISATQTTLCAYLEVNDRLEGVECDRLLGSLSELLKSQFSIQEITLQVTSGNPIEKSTLHPLFERSLMDYVI
jgi:Co/Zn/Cd efflux system component